MEDTELGKEIVSILSGVEGKGLGDNFEGSGEFSNSELLTGSHSSGEVVEVNSEGNFDGTTSSNDGVGLKDSLNNTERIMDGSLNLIEEEVVSSSADDSLSAGFGHAFEEHVFPVSNSSFLNKIARSEVRGVEGFFAGVNISERDNNLSTGVVSNSSQIGLVNTSYGNDVSLNEVLKSEIINTSGAENDVSAGVNDHFTSLLADIHLSLSDFIKVIGVLNENLDSHLHSELVEVEVNASNLGVLHHLGHSLRRAGSFNSISINEFGFFTGHTVRFKNMDGFDGVFNLTLSVNVLNVLHGLDDNLGIEVCLTTDKLGAHGGLGSVDEGISIETSSLDSKVLLNLVDTFFKCKPVARHN